jgi:fructoselysine 6-kinase
MLRIIGVGDNTVDTYLHRRMRFPGGNAVNVAVHARRLGAESAYLGSFGDDAKGRLILGALRAENVDISRCRVVPGVPNAFAEVNLVEGERVFGKHESGASAMLQLDKADLAYISNFDAIHTSFYSFLDNLLERMRSKGQLLSYDFSDHLDEWGRIVSVFPQVDVAIFSISGCLGQTVQDVVARLDPRADQIVILTQGRMGSWASAGRQLLHQPIIPVNTVDTMGAGDAFIAGFLVEYLNGASLERAMRRAAEYAAENCLQMGAIGHGEAY